MSQIQELDSSLERAVEAYNLANVRLARIKHDLRDNTNALVVARKSLVHAQAQLSARIVDIYTSGDQNAGLAVLLGASSLDDMLGRMDASDVAERNAARASVQQQLGERKQLLGSIQGEIEHLKAAEAAREAQLQRQAQFAAQAASQRQASLAPTVGIGSGSTISPTPTAPPATHGGVVGIAMQYLGTPYVWGGASPSGFDCSGFVMYVYGQMGVSLPHSSYAQYGYGSPVSMSQLQAGDLVFFDGLGHVGIYVGGGTFIHSPHTGDVVKISSLSGWYASTFVGGRRL